MKGLRAVSSRMAPGMFSIEKTSSGYTIPTELVSTLFGAGVSLGGIGAGIIAGSRLGRDSARRLPVKDLLVPVGVSVAATTAAAFLPLTS